MLLRLWLLFLSMAKAGTLSWGGAQALIPFFQADCVSRYGWISAEHFSEMVGIDVTLPGVFAVKLAAMIGWEVAGFAGLLVSVVGLCLPGVVLFMGLFGFLQTHRENRWVMSMLNGVQYGAAGLIAVAILQVLPSGANRGTMRAFIMGLGLMAVVFVALKLKWVSPAVAMLGAAVIGIILAL